MTQSQLVGQWVGMMISHFSKTVQPEVAVPGGAEPVQRQPRDGGGLPRQAEHPGAVAMVSPWSVGIGTELAPAARSVPDLSRAGR